MAGQESVRQRTKKESSRSGWNPCLPFRRWWTKLKPSRDFAPICVLTRSASLIHLAGGADWRWWRNTRKTWGYSPRYLFVSTRYTMSSMLPIDTDWMVFSISCYQWNWLCRDVLLRKYKNSHLLSRLSLLGQWSLRRNRAGQFLVLSWTSIHPRVR